MSSCNLKHKWSMCDQYETQGNCGFHNTQRIYQCDDRTYMDGTSVHGTTYNLHNPWALWPWRAILKSIYRRPYESHSSPLPQGLLCLYATNQIDSHLLFTFQRSATISALAYIMEQVHTIPHGHETMPIFWVIPGSPGQTVPDIRCYVL